MATGHSIMDRLYMGVVVHFPGEHHPIVLRGENVVRRPYRARRDCVRSSRMNFMTVIWG